MDFLKKSLAPITAEAWSEIESQAKTVLRSRLTARKFVDVDGPKGLNVGAVTLGRLDIPTQQKKNDVQYGIHQVLPLIETRTQFRLKIWELDNLARGAEDIDLSPLDSAAIKIAEFEERAIYYGFKAAKVPGLKAESAYPLKSCPKNAQEAICGIPEGIRLLKEAAVEGPYSLVANPKKWQEINSYGQGYPLNKQLKDILEGEIILCPSIEGLFLVSKRGGDFRLTLGTDLSIGYESHTADEVQLYFTESFTFQVFEPAAVVVFEG
ncbi:bacteriocin family protein [candidate division KSB1 bacterium]|nr:bacteriocin family protein [candidate division KSB1 bacterium]